MTSKKWGKKLFWGVTSEFDPEWNLNEDQIALRDKLIEICRTKIRPQAVKVDQTYNFPTESLKAMHSLGLLGLIIPKELGGLNESNICALMICETLARYGCPSTALVFCMHLNAVSIMLMRYHNNEEAKLLFRRICTEGLVGTVSYADPGTGGHLWFPLSSKAERLDDDNFKVFRFSSWATSAGFADFYALTIPTPGKVCDHSNQTIILVFNDEIRASKDSWSALGMHGNQSGPILFEGKLHKSRIIGQLGEGVKIIDEIGLSLALMCMIASFNGTAMACIDIAKKHVLQKTHGDVGMRVADYPIIQDMFGNSLSRTNACRCFLLAISQYIDKVSNYNDWSIYEDSDAIPRTPYTQWLIQSKYATAENVSRVADQMLRACGGDGYKNDLGLERVFRDAKAACVMGPANEVVKSMVGKSLLFGSGPQNLDLWNKISNEQTLHREIKKMTLQEKKDLLKKIADDIELEEDSNLEEGSNPVHGRRYQTSEFENPFNTAPPTSVQSYTSQDGIQHSPALNSTTWTYLDLVSRRDLNDTVSSFIFAFPDPDSHLGCIAGQYIQVRVPFKGKFHERSVSPVSPPGQFGSLEVILKYESHGIVSNVFKNLQIGDKVEFRGPCGGFEYEPNRIEELTLIASGVGVTPGLQLVRNLVRNRDDRTTLSLIYSATEVEDFLCLEELRTITDSDSRLRLFLVPVNSPESWDMEEGYLDRAFLEKYVPKHYGSKHKIIICGSPSVTISCLHALQHLKFPSEMIFVYGLFGVEHIRAVYGRNARLSGHNFELCGN